MAKQQVRSSTSGSGELGGIGVGVDVDISGAKELMALFDALPGRVQRKVLSGALRDSVKIVAEKVRAEMPVDTGTAQRAVVVRTPKKKKRGTVAFNVQYETVKIVAKELAGTEAKRTTKAAKAIASGNTKRVFFYPAAFEYGVPSRNIPRRAPMRKAYEQAGPLAVKVAERTIAAGIEREAALLRRT